jgi:hypothetical protein
VRFASVYRCFADVGSLREIVEELEAGRAAAPGGQGSTPPDSVAEADPVEAGPPRRPRWRGRPERRERDRDGAAGFADVEAAPARP